MENNNDITKYKFLCRRPSPEEEKHTDLLLKIYKPKPLPPKFDLNKNMEDVYDQGELGSCSANASCSAYKFACKAQPMVATSKEAVKKFEPSRLYLYYKDRELSHNENIDSGASISDNVQVLMKNGVCCENLWEYNIDKFNMKPPKNCDEDALTHRAVKYNKIGQSELQIKNSIYNGYPVIFGMIIKESIYKINQSNYIYQPFVSEPVLGGHALLIIGYDDTTKLFNIRNSWSKDFGNQGNFCIPYSIILDATTCWDFWNISLTTN